MAPEGTTMDLSPLIRGLQRNRTIFRILGAVMAVLAVGMAFLPVSKANEVWIKIAVIAFFAAFGVLLVALSFRSPEQYKVIRTLRESPGDVAWLYPVKRLHNGVHAATVVYFHLRNGKKLECP